MKIDEVSQKYNLTKDTLRYYEKIGLLQNIKRNSSGNREYSVQDLERIEFIICIRKAGLTLNQIKEYTALVHQGDKTLDQRKDVLLEQKECVLLKIKELEETLQYLDYKINIYDNKKNK